MSSDRSTSENAIGLNSPNQDGTAGTEVTVVRTYLAMERPEQLRDRSLPSAQPRLEAIEACPVERWRQLYRDIGAPWAWHDRDAWTDAQLSARLQLPTVRVFELLPAAGQHPIGFLELERHDDGSVEIVYLGLHLRVIGTGIGAWFIATAVREAFAFGASRVWLHTCTLDSPSALPNYIARGFTPERSETYIARIRP